MPYNSTCYFVGGSGQNPLLPGDMQHLSCLFSDYLTGVVLPENSNEMLRLALRFDLRSSNKKDHHLLSACCVLDGSSLQTLQEIINAIFVANGCVFFL